MKNFTSIIFTAAAAIAGCSSQYGGEMTRPVAAEFQISSNVLFRFDPDARETLMRYLAGNARWEIRKERGRYFAIRRQVVDGAYKTTLNGFYSEHRGESWYQNRVLLSFDYPYGFGMDRGQMTRITVGETNTVRPVLEGPHSGSPGYTSYIMFLGPSVNLEIMEQQPKQERTFTQQAFQDVCAELEQVLKHSDKIASTGRMPVTEAYPIAPPSEPQFGVNDGMQPGIFLVEAWVAPRAKGEAFLKVFNTKTGNRLSEERITPRSTRFIGWSRDGTELFPYNSEVTVYEGDWDHQYEARFELWHRSEQGLEDKLAETTRMINGWQR